MSCGARSSRYKNPTSSTRAGRIVVRQKRPDVTTLSARSSKQEQEDLTLSSILRWLSSRYALSSASLLRVPIAGSARPPAGIRAPGRSWSSLHNHLRVFDSKPGGERGAASGP